MANEPRNESDNPQPAPKPDKPSKGWIDKLADRSTGLERDAQPDDQDAAERRRLWRLGGLGIQFAGTVGLFWWFGMELDRWFHTGYAWTIGLACVAIVGNLYLLIKEALRQNK